MHTFTRKMVASDRSRHSAELRCPMGIDRKFFYLGLDALLNRCIELFEDPVSLIRLRELCVTSGGPGPEPDFPAAP